MVAEHLLDLLLLELGNVLNAHFVLGVLGDFRLVQVVEALMICLHLLSLVVHAPFKFDSVVFHHLGLPLGIAPLFLVLLH